MNAGTTSEMRKALCRAICSRAYGADDPTVRRELAAELELVPFERMTDDALVALGVRMIGRDATDRIRATHSAAPVEVRETFMCPTCRDQRVVGSERDGFARCPRCNPGRAPEVVVTGIGVAGTL